jgi:hypothetical protein
MKTLSINHGIPIIIADFYSHNTKIYRITPLQSTAVASFTLQEFENKNLKTHLILIQE